MLFWPGPTACHEVPGLVPHGAGGGGHAVRGGKEREDLLPWLLQVVSQEVQGVWWGEFQAGVVQGENSIKSCNLFCRLF